MPVTVRNTDILFNDGSTQSTAAGAVNTTTVLNATAGASVGAVGTYAFLRPTNTVIYSPGNTLGGGSLVYNSGLTDASGASVTNDGASASGTWRCMGHRHAVRITSYGTPSIAGGATLWLRIS